MNSDSSVAALDRAVCSACGGTVAPLLATPDRNREASSVVFHYTRCGRCGLVSLANLPHDLRPYYDNEYHALPGSEIEIERGIEHERYKIELVRRHAAGGRLLEIGPSWGAFCLLAKRAGFEVEAIEMDPRCCEFLTATIGVRAIRSVDDAAAIAQAFVPDVIALWHVIEHTRDPWTLLARAAERLAPGGAIVVATPNPSAFQFRVLGRLWVHVDAPRHLHLIPAAVLREKMRALGMQEELCSTRDAGSLRWNAFGWSWSFANLVSQTAIKRALRLCGRVLAWLLAPIEGREGAGSAYTSVFRKPGG
jgi:2-polyprenyl-3-methyl-5-hydroxy-6-metoxy-1,4-benzoquinol methylase